MKLARQLVFIALVLVLTLNAQAYTINGNAVEYINHAGEIRVEPHTVSIGDPFNPNPVTQYANLTAYATRTVNVTFLFDAPLKTGSLEYWNGAGWTDITSSIVHETFNGKSAYTKYNTAFTANDTLQVKWSFLPSTPTGKWELYFWTGTRENPTILANLDPWWNSSCEMQRSIGVTALNAMHNNMTGFLAYNHSTDVSDGYTWTNGSDVHFAWYNESNVAWTEIDRVNLSNWNDASVNTTIAFRLQDSINNGATDGNYSLFFNCSGVNAALSNESNVYWFFDDFNRASLNSNNDYEGLNGFTGWSINGSTDLFVNAGWNTAWGILNSSKYNVTNMDSSMFDYDVLLDYYIDQGEIAGFGVRSNVTGNATHIFEYSSAANYVVGLSRAWIANDLTLLEAASTLPLDVWYNFKVRANGSTLNVSYKNQVGNNNYTPRLVILDNNTNVNGFVSFLGFANSQRFYDNLRIAVTGANYPLFTVGDIFTQAVVITINEPINKTYSSTPTLNWTATSLNDSTIPCNWSVDGGSITSVNVTNATPYTTSLGALASAAHYVNVSCVDSSPSSVSISTTYFTVMSGFYANVFDELNWSVISTNVTIANTSNTTYLNENTTFAVPYTDVANGAVTVTFSNTSYYSRKYYCSINSGTSCELDAYLLPIGTSYYVRFHLYHYIGYPVSVGGNVSIYKNINGSSVLIAQDQCDASGTCGFDLEAAASYTVYAYSPDSSFTATITANQPDFYVYFSTTAGSPAYYNTSGLVNVTYFFLPASTWLFNNFTPLSFTVSDASANLSYSGFYVYFSNSSGTVLLNSSNLTTASGSFSVHNFTRVGVASGNITVVGFFKKSGYDQLNYTQSYLVVNYTVYNSTLANTIEDLRDSGATTGLGLLSIVLAALIAGAVLMRAGVSAGTLAGVLSLTLFAFVGWLDWRIWLLSFVFGLIAWFYERGRGTF